jgi:hypothetical protein
MVPRMSSPIVPRSFRWKWLLVPVLAMSVAAGCGHRRSAMRPVYTSPPVVAPCPTPGTPIITEPGVSGPSTLEPVAPIDTTVAPTAVTPPRPMSAEEPGFEPVAPESSNVPAPSASPSAKPNGGSNSNGPALVPPSTQLNRPTGPTASGGRSRVVALRERVRPYVNDPDDLFLPPKADRPWKYVVLHHSAKETGSYDEIDHEHRKVLGWEGCGYHFVIGNGTGSPDGQIEVASRWSNQKHGVHCRDGKTSDVNEYGIGICLVGNLDKTAPTARQIAASKALVAYLGERYAIPTGRIETHSHLAASPTACPGKHFPTDSILGSNASSRHMAALAE